LSEIAEQLKTLRDFHTRPIIEYRRGDALTHHVLDVLSDHVLNGYVPRNLDPSTQRTQGRYKVLVLSQPSEPGLEKHVKNLRTFVPGPFRRWVPEVDVDAPELLNLQGKPDKKWHSVIASTLMEHQPDGMKGLMALHKRLEDDGCLLVVMHKPGGTYPAGMERDAAFLRQSFIVLQDFAQKKVSGRDAVSRLREFDFHGYAGIPRVQEWLEKFMKDPEARRVVRNALKEDAFAAAGIVAHRLRSNAKKPLQWMHLLEEAGFHVHPGYEFEAGAQRHPVIVVSAYKGRCPADLNANER